MNPWYLDPLYITIRVILALILGGMIGFEREKNSIGAGFRTHILVCVGSALIMLLSEYGFPQFADESNVRIDPSRLAAQVVSGVGFLGAGTILRHGLSIKGLTTAASLWVVAAIGLAAGAGYYYGAILVTCLVLASLLILNIVEKRFLHRKQLYTIKVDIKSNPGVVGTISALLEKKGIEVLRLALEEDDRNIDIRTAVTLYVKFPNILNVVDTVDEIRHLPHIIKVSVE